MARDWLRALLRLSLLLGLVGSSWWLLNLATGPAEEAAARAERAPDAYLKDFELVEMDEQGRPRQKISGARMDHFADTRTSEVVRPRVDLYSQNDRPAWQIDAEGGIMPDHADVVTLIGKVQARTADGENRETVIDTADVEIDTQANTARSDAAVKITSAMGVTDGVGLRADMSARRYQLLSNVRSEHTPARAGKPSGAGASK